MSKRYGDVEVTDLGDFVALVEIQRPPNNHFDFDLIHDLADAFDHLDGDPNCRVSVLAAEGKHFCAGAVFGAARDEGAATSGAEPQTHLYVEAVRLFSNKKQVVAAIQGAAVGGGFGLAMFPDFRVGCPESRFTTNFVKLGFVPGFGLTHTLPRTIGQQAAQDLFYTGRRIGGEEAHRIGIVDRLAPSAAEVRDAAIAFAREMAENAPLALQSVREFVRGDIADAVKAATDKERDEQDRLQQTNDWKEGVKSVAERRVGNFTGT